MIDSLLLKSLIAGVIASICFGIIGSFVVSRRISYITGAISHSILGGIGLGVYLEYLFPSMTYAPILGAFLFAILAAIVFGIIREKSKSSEDTVVGALWAFGMAIGLVFIFKTPGYIDPMSYLFGNILLIGDLDLYLLGGWSLVLVVLLKFLYQRFVLISFDEELAKIRGVNVSFYNLLMLVLVAVSTVFLIRLVGIILVIAMFTIPAAISLRYCRSLSRMIWTSIVLSSIFSISGLTVSYFLDLPSGPVIILMSSICYFSQIFLGGRRKLI